MKSLSIVLTLIALATTGGVAQMREPMLSENTAKISDHVWAIMGFPNIAIVVGTRSVLVVDTGLGRSTIHGAGDLLGLTVERLP